jgi:putative peptide zinc metalloprotease protein
VTVGHSDVALSPERRLNLAPMVIHRRPGGGAVLGPRDGSAWIEVDDVGADVLEHLDRGLTLAEVQTQLLSAGHAVDVMGFAADLHALGLVSNTSGRLHTSALQPFTPTPGPRWAWWVFTGWCGMAAAFLVAQLLSDSAHLPNGADLLLPDAPVVAAVAVAIGASLVAVALHEAAHLLVARVYGLRPRVQLGRRGWWLVAETDLNGIWALTPRDRWRSIAAGPMADVSVLGISLLVQHIAPVEPVARVVGAVLVAHLLWQAQWYLETDCYYLMTTAVDMSHLRGAAWRAITSVAVPARCRAAGQHALSKHERFAVTAYLLSLPGAGLASVALIWWCLVPLAQQLLMDLGHG